MKLHLLVHLSSFYMECLDPNQTGSPLEMPSIRGPVERYALYAGGESIRGWGQIQSNECGLKKNS